MRKESEEHENRCNHQGSLNFDLTDMRIGAELKRVDHQSTSAGRKRIFSLKFKM